MVFGSIGKMFKEKVRKKLYSVWFDVKPVKENVCFLGYIWDD